MVFQDPYGALNPLHTVEYTVMRPGQNFLNMSAAQSRQHVAELPETVGLTPASQFAAKLPRQQHPQHSYTIQLLDAVATPFAAADAGTPSGGRRET